jgi:hypothetical protein
LVTADGDGHVLGISIATDALVLVAAGVDASQDRVTVNLGALLAAEGTVLLAAEGPVSKVLL